MSRRSIVRAGAAAAWSAPLVLVLTAAPAQATCSTPANKLVLNPGTPTTSHTGGNPGGQTLVGPMACTITNTGGTPGQAVTVTATVQFNKTVFTGAITYTAASASGWTGGTAESPLGSGTFAFTKSLTLAANATDSSFTPSFNLAGGDKSSVNTTGNTVTLLATGCGTGGFANFTVP